MSTPSQFERFSGNNFLLERGRANLRYIARRSQQRSFSFLIRLLLFGGFLGLIWTLSHLHPHGDLSLYLIPITLLAIPIGLIAPRDQTWHRIVNVVFIFIFSFFLIWSAVWYFQFPEWNYAFRWISIEAGLVTFLGWTTLRKRARSWEGPQQNLLFNLWVIGLLLTFSSLGFLGYYIGTQSSPEASTSNILTGLTFLFFLTLTIVRVFWLDSIRLRRANRGEHVPPQDHILLLEWLIPRSYSFVVTLIMLLIAQAMMFSTIYRAGQIKYLNESEDVHKILPHKTYESHWANESPSFPSLSPSSPLSSPSPTSPTSLTPSNPLASPLSPLLPIQKWSKVSLGDWILFSFKPYVFPKDEMAREVPAPKWFKYLGRALLSIIFAILLTKQLNIWKQIGALYLTLLGAVRRMRLQGYTLEDQRQSEEMYANLNAMFNTHASFWRWQLLYAVTAPTLSLKWRILLDPSSAFFEGIERLRLWVVVRWDMALFVVSFLIALSTFPFAYLEDLIWSNFTHVILPSFIIASFIFILRVIVGLKPPKSYQSWIWWILLFHFIVALVYFFLSINIGSTSGFWQSILWYTQLCTIGVFPALYLFGGERHRRVSSFMLRTHISKSDTDYQIRKSLLYFFVQTEHRQWMAQELTRRIHPVRNGIQLSLLLPLLQISILDGLRSLIEHFGDTVRRWTESYPRSLLLWFGFQSSIWVLFFIINLFTAHRLSPQEVSIAYLVQYGCLLFPYLAPLGYWIGYKLQRKKGTLENPDYPSDLVMQTIILSLISMGMEGYLYWLLPIWDELPISFTLVWLSTFPALPIWALMSKKIHSVFGSTQTLGIFDKISNWLSERENRYLKSVYRDASKFQEFDLDLRNELVRGYGLLLESTYQALRKGTWYQEENHAIRRVYRQWIGSLDRLEEEEIIAEELISLQEKIVDALGSLLYDLSATQRFDESASPSLTVILETLIEVIQHPIPSSLHHEATLSNNLQDVYQALEALVMWLLEERQSTSSVLKEDLLTPEHDQLLLILLGSLNTDLGLEYLTHCVEEQRRSESTFFKLETLLKAVFHHQKGGELARSLAEIDPTNQSFLFYARKHLPTPLAVVFTRLIHQHQNHLRSRSISSPLPSSPDLSSHISPSLLSPHTQGYYWVDPLTALQRPQALTELYQELHQKKEQEHAKFSLYSALSEAYFVLFGYLLGTLKDRWSDEQVQNLPWHNADPLLKSIKVLKRKKIPPLVQPLSDLILDLFSHSTCKAVERAFQTQRDAERIYPLVLDLYKKTLEHPALPYLLWSPYSHSDTALLLQGESPSEWISSTQEENQSFHHRLGRGVRLEGIDQRPLIHFYPALWVLKLLDGLAQSDELFHPEEESVSGERLQQVHSLMHRFGQLLRPFATEEQTIITRLYEHIINRIKVLSDLDDLKLESLEGQGQLDFNETLNKISKYLDALEERALRRFSHLFKLKLLPTSSFMFLEGVEDAHIGELRWYASFSDLPPVLTVVHDEIGLADGGVLWLDSAEETLNHEDLDVESEQKIEEILEESTLNPTEEEGTVDLKVDELIENPHERDQVEETETYGMDEVIEGEESKIEIENEQLERETTTTCSDELLTEENRS